MKADTVVVSSDYYFLTMIVERLSPISEFTKTVVARVHPTTYCLKQIDPEAKYPEYKQVEKSIFRKDENDMSAELYKAYKEYEFYNIVYSKRNKGRIFELIVRVELKDSTVFNISLINIRGTANILKAVYQQVEENTVENIAVVSYIDITDKYSFPVIKEMYDIYYKFMVKERNKLKAERYRSTLSASGKQVLDFMFELSKLSEYDIEREEEEENDEH